MGKAIRGVVHAFLETSKRERVSLVLVVVGAIFIGFVLFGKGWDLSQAYQAPIFPPLAVFVISNLMPLLVTFGHYYFHRPIVWDNKIEDSL